MFEIGSYVAYRSEGVCVISDIRAETFGAPNNSELYYILTPVRHTQSTLFVPVKNENLTEAQAMCDYLLSKGIPQDIIIKEDKSTTTYENFVFSTEILKEKLGEDYSVAFVSNSFHIYRAEKLAKSLGINATHLGAGIEWHTVPANYLREVSVLFGLVVLKKK